ncbi:MAG: hypothetical protein ABFS34_05930 [Gemmatimonadota bacterium]
MLANTEPAAEALRTAHPWAWDKVTVVRNGWDQLAHTSIPRGRFTVSYAGTIYGDRSPSPLFEAVARLRAVRPLSPKTFGVEFMGRIEPGEDWVVALADAAGVADLVRLHPAADRQAAARFMARAAVLVSLPWGQDLAVPAKVYDYLTFEAWPLILARSNSAPARMLAGTGAHVADPGDPAGIAELLCGLYDRWCAGERPGPVAGREAFSRAAAASALVECLEAYVE